MINIKIVKHVVRKRNKKQEDQEGIYDNKFPQESVKIKVKKILESI